MNEWVKLSRPLTSLTSFIYMLFTLLGPSQKHNQAGRGEGGEGFTPEQHIAVNTSTVPVIQKSTYRVFWEVDFFSSLSFLVLIV